MRFGPGPLHDIALALASTCRAMIDTAKFSAHQSMPRNVWPAGQRGAHSEREVRVAEQNTRGSAPHAQRSILIANHQCFSSNPSPTSQQPG